MLYQNPAIRSRVEVHLVEEAKGGPSKLLLSFLYPFPFILFSCSPPQVKRVNRFPWLMAQTMRFHPRKCLFGVKFDITGSVTPKTAKSGRGLWFPSQTRRIDKNSVSQSNEEISTQNLNRRWQLKVHIRFRVRGHLSSNPRWRQPPL
jgi:hypothetical protein